MSKIPVPRNRSTSNSQRRSSRSVGTQTNESNYNTLHNNAVSVNSSPPFASTPTTSRNARRVSHASQEEPTNQTSIEAPKDIVSNMTQFRHTTHMGRSSISNLTEMNANSKSRSVSGGPKNVMFADENHSSDVPTTSAAANMPNQQRKSSITVTRLSQIPQQTSHHEPLPLIPEPIAENLNETYDVVNNLDVSSIHSSAEDNSTPHRDSGLVLVLVETPPRKRRASQKATQRRSMKMTLVEEYDAEIRELRNYDPAVSNRRRSMRLLTKRLNRLTAAKNDLINELKRESQLRDVDQVAPKRSKQSQHLKVKMNFVTLRPHNEGFSEQQRRIKKNRKSRTTITARMVEEWTHWTHRYCFSYIFLVFFLQNKSFFNKNLFSNFHYYSVNLSFSDLFLT